MGKTLLERCTSNLGHQMRLLILITIVFVYLVIGALVFSALEVSQERFRIASLRVVREEFAAKIKTSVTDDELEDFIRKVVDASRAGIPAMNNVTFSSSWSFGQSFFFVGTLVTTIGYGHTLPLSYNGKIFAVFYSLVGVPLTLIMFSAVASRLMFPLSALLRALKDRMMCVRRMLYIRLLHFLIVLFVLLVFFFLVPAAVFTTIETNWNYFDSLYYCFISLTTIGLGDYIPGEKHIQPYRALYKIGVTIYLFLGVIFLMTTIGVLCNIKELNFSDYFVLDNIGDDVDEEHEQLTPKDAGDPLHNYTDEKVELAGDVEELVP